MLAIRWGQMHAKTWRGLDFDDGASVLFQGVGDRLAHHIDTADVEADELGGPDGTRSKVRVDLIGAVVGWSAGDVVSLMSQGYPVARPRLVLRRLA